MCHAPHTQQRGARVDLEGFGGVERLKTDQIEGAVQRVVCPNNANISGKGRRDERNTIKNDILHYALMKEQGL